MPFFGTVRIYHLGPSAAAPYTDDVYVIADLAHLHRLQWAGGATTSTVTVISGLGGDNQWLGSEAFRLVGVDRVPRVWRLDVPVVGVGKARSLRFAPGPPPTLTEEWTVNPPAPLKIGDVDPTDGHFVNAPSTWGAPGFMQGSSMQVWYVATDIRTNRVPVIVTQLWSGLNVSVSGSADWSDWNRGALYPGNFTYAGISLVKSNTITTPTPPPPPDRYLFDASVRMFFAWVGRNYVLGAGLHVYQNTAMAGIRTIPVTTLWSSTAQPHDPGGYTTLVAVFSPQDLDLTDPSQITTAWNPGASILTAGSWYAFYGGAMFFGWGLGWITNASPPANTVSVYCLDSSHALTPAFDLDWLGYAGAPAMGVTVYADRGFVTTTGVLYYLTWSWDVTTGTLHWWQRSGSTWVYVQGFTRAKAAWGAPKVSSLRESADGRTIYLITASLTLAVEVLAVRIDQTPLGVEVLAGSARSGSAIYPILALPPA